jgi:hypothetical protein
VALALKEPGKRAEVCVWGMSGVRCCERRKVGRRDVGEHARTYIDYREQHSIEQTGAEASRTVSVRKG